MPRRYIPRALEPVLRKAAAQFPAVVLTGPRQSGKTTLLKHVFGETFGYVSLEAPDVRAAAGADPRGFLDMHPAPVVIDEVQYAPDLLPYIKERIDDRREAHGQYLLTGSQNLLLTQQVTESLAGRAAMLRLLPVSQREEFGRPLDPAPWEPHSSLFAPHQGYPASIARHRGLQAWLPRKPGIKRLLRAKRRGNSMRKPRRSPVGERWP
jgi:hypothetical protein